MWIEPTWTNRKQNYTPILRHNQPHCRGFGCALDIKIASNRCLSYVWHQHFHRDDHGIVEFCPKVVMMICYSYLQHVHAKGFKYVDQLTQLMDLFLVERCTGTSWTCKKLWVTSWYHRSSNRPQGCFHGGRAKLRKHIYVYGAQRRLAVSLPLLVIGRISVGCISTSPAHNPSYCWLYAYCWSHVLLFVCLPLPK